MKVIVGIDPGSRITGYGVILQQGQQLSYRASGCIRVTEKTLALRLQQIANGITQVLDYYQPQAAAIEDIFVGHNPRTALKLGQARGVVIVTLARYDLPVAEYAARRVKQAVVGYGAASKQQVQHMVRVLLGLSKAPQADAADALAVAICHAHSHSMVEVV